MTYTDNKEPKKIVLIIGNGFDLDLGLKTLYKDFWESEFCPRDYPAPIIDHLNKKWPDDRDGVNWYDLENELFNYYHKIKGKRVIPDIFTEIERRCLLNADMPMLESGYFPQYGEAVASLIEKGAIKVYSGSHYYLSISNKEDLKYNALFRDKKALRLIKKGLCEYLSNLKYDTVGNSISYYILYALIRSKEEGDFCNIYSFNYTPLPSPYNNSLKEDLQYVHGNLEDKTIIIGTQDNIEYDENYDFLQKSFDPEYNPPMILPNLLNADEVIIFGHSLGVNDRQYFKNFFMQQTSTQEFNRKKITIFTYNDVSETNIKRSIQWMTGGNLSTFYSMNDVKIIKTSFIKRMNRDTIAFEDFLKDHLQDPLDVKTQMQQVLSNNDPIPHK